MNLINETGINKSLIVHEILHEINKKHGDFECNFDKDGNIRFSSFDHVGMSEEDFNKTLESFNEERMALHKEIMQIIEKARDRLNQTNT